MKKILLLGIITVTVLCGCLLSGCYLIEDLFNQQYYESDSVWEPPEYMPDYDEDKAGAHVVRKIDLSGRRYSYYDDEPYLFLAKNSDKAYFVSGNNFYEYEVPVPNEDKNKYTNKFRLDDHLFNSTDYSYIYDVRSVTLVDDYLYIFATYYLKYNGPVIEDSQYIESRGGRNLQNVFVVKPDGSDLKILSSDDLFGADIKFNFDFYYNVSRKKMYLWFGRLDFVTTTLYSYDYDASNGKFIPDTTTDIILVPRDLGDYHVFCKGYITDNNFWLVNCSKTLGEVYLNTLEQRSVDNPNNIVKNIDLLYLQFDQIPEAVIEYDGYVWVEITRYEKLIKDDWWVNKYYLLQLELK